MHAFLHLVILGASTVSSLNAAQNASASALAAQIPACAVGTTSKHLVNSFADISGRYLATNPVFKPWAAG